MRGPTPKTHTKFPNYPKTNTKNSQTLSLSLSNPYLFSLTSSLTPHSQMTHKSLLILLLTALLLLTITPSRAYISENAPTKPPLRPSSFREAPIFRNGVGCLPKTSPSSTIHIAMTLDTTYLRGSIAGVLSVLQHAACPENVAFHFLHSSRRRLLLRTVAAVFPDLPFRLYPFDSALVRNKISYSVRTALDQPLNYARIYLADVLPAAVRRVIYLDSDLVLVDDVAKLWSTPLPSSSVLAAPEYCHANFSSYFTPQFWLNPSHARALHERARPPCYFNTGVMVIDLARWRAGGYTRRLEYWMAVQKRRRIYDLGSLPPFLLVFGGEVEGVEHRWNQHGLGGDNLRGLCRDLHPGPVSLLHWSGKGKPWLRLDSGSPCPLDYLWAPYDLYRHPDLFSDS